MRILGDGKETFLYLNGIEVPRPIKLGEEIQIFPAKCVPTQDLIIDLFKDSFNIGVAAIFLYQVRSQIKISASGSKELAIKAWNSIWDGILLSAFFDCEAVCNFQSDTSADLLNEKSKISITNHHLRGLHHKGTKPISEDDCAWIESNYDTLNKLCDDPLFLNALNALATFRWHGQPRVRLAILWAGIEGLFKIDSELSFRLSLYIARMLYPNDSVQRKVEFEKVKKLYKQRSVAVHGAEIKGDRESNVVDSVLLLRTILKKCVENKSMPKIDELAP